MHRLFLPLAVMILFIAAILRIVQLDTYPPGPHFDEAANVLITRSIAFGGANLFPITNSFQGRESLYFYLNAPLFQLIHDAPFTMRLSSVFMNLITIAASMRLGRAMFRGNRGLVVGIIAGISMALSFNQILLSRQMFRVISLPMMQSLAFLFLWQGINKQRLFLIAVGGFFAGGTLYTYMSSRLLPVWLVLGAVALLYIDRKNWRIRLRQGIVFFGVMGLTLLPLIMFAIDNPDIFFQRLDEVTSDEYGKVTLIESIELHLKMFFIRGDFGNIRLNDPGRPYFSSIEGFALVIGLLIAGRRFLKQGNTLECLGYLMLLFSPLMIIPSVLAVGGLPPSHMRSLAMVPLIFIVVGVGFEFLFQRLIEKPSKPVIFGGVLLIMCVGGLLVGRDYFSWAKQGALFNLANGDLAMAMQWLPSVKDDDTLVYVASLYPEHPTVLIASDDPPTSLGSDSLILPPPGSKGISIFSREILPAPEWQGMLASGQIMDVPAGPDGQPAFLAFMLDGDMALPPMDVPDTPVKNAYVTFLGMYADAALSGGRASFTMVWHVDQTLSYYNLWPNIVLKNDDGVIVASDSVYLLGVDRWRAGETILQRAYIDIPIGTPPAQYELAISWVDRASNTFLPFTGEETGIEAELGYIQIIRPNILPSADSVSVDFAHDVAAGDGVRLLGWNKLPSSVRPGETLQPTLFWQAVTPDDEERTLPDLQAILRDASGVEVLLWNGMLDYAPNQWVANELVKSWFKWRIPATQPSGDYILVLRNTVMEVELTPIEIVGLPRVFESPEIEVETDVTFGDMITLQGYSLDKTENTTGHDIELELVWKPEQLIYRDYSIFVHLVNADDEIIQQFDMMPLQNSYPMSLWLSGEYVTERYVFTDVVESDELYLRIGVYLPENGLRLPVDVNKEADFFDILIN